MHRVIIGWICWIIALSVSYPQGKEQRRPLPFLTAAENGRVYILILDAPREMRGFNVYRKGATETKPVLLTQEPVRPVVDAFEAREMLGSLYAYVADRMKTDDPRIVHQRLRSDPGFATLISMMSPAAGRVTGRSFLDSAAGTGRTLEYTVALVGPTGKEFQRHSQIIQTIEVKPGQPREVTLSARSGEVRVQWLYAPYAGQPTDYVIGFHVYRTTGDDPPVRMTTVPVLRQENRLLWFDRTVQNRKHYRYHVTAVDILGRESSPSDPGGISARDDTPPRVPGALQAFSHEGTIQLAWSVKLDDDLSHFNIYRGFVPEDSVVRLNRYPIPATVFSYIDSQVVYGPNYVYRLTAVDSSANESRKSVSVIARPRDSTPPPAPLMVFSSAAGRYVDVSWTKPVAKDLKGYHVFRGRNSTDLIRIVRTPLRADSTRFVDKGDGSEGLAPGATYFYGVSAIDSAHNESSVVIFPFRVPDKEPPGPPNDFRGKTTRIGDIQLSWQASTSLDVVAYRVYQGDDSSSLRMISTVEGFGFRDTSTSPGRLYVYQLSAIDSSGNESPKTNLETVIARSSHKSVAPFGVRAHLIQRGVEVVWRSNKGKDLRGFNLYRSRSLSRGFERVNNALIGDTAYVDPLGEAGFHYKVTSVSTSGSENTTNASVRVKK